MTKETNDSNSNVDTRESRKVEFSVIDTTQFGQLPRRHEIITRMYPKVEGQQQIPPETITYELWRDKRVPMPMEHAMKFLKEKAFHVFGSDGRRIEPITQIDPSKPLSQLADHEVIANLNELSRDALFRRVKVIPGSEDISHNAKADELVAFLIDWKKRQRKMSQGEAALSEMMTSGQLGGGMTSDMLDTMFPAKRAA